MAKLFVGGGGDYAVVKLLGGGGYAVAKLSGGEG